MILICCLILSTGLPSAVTSDDLEMLFRDYWGDWVYHDQAWYLVAPAISAGKVTVWRWREGETLELWAESGPREGIRAQSAVTIDPVDKKLLLRCLVTTRVFSLDLRENKPEFVRVQTAADLSGSMVIWNQRLVGAAEPFSLKVYSGEPFDLLDKINRLLPDDTFHPSQKAVSTHKMLFAKGGDRLAVGFSLYPNIVLFETRPHLDRSLFSIRFPGYLEPPDTYIDPYTDRANREYFEGFHHLVGLSWFQNTPYGHLKRGYSTTGLWVSLGEPDIFLWDNTKQAHQILAMSNDQIVMGIKSEDTEGSVSWKLWIETELPGIP